MRSASAVSPGEPNSTTVSPPSSDVSGGGASSLRPRRVSAAEELAQQAVACRLLALQALHDPPDRHVEQQQRVGGDHQTGLQRLGNDLGRTGGSERLHVALVARAHHDGQVGSSVADVREQLHRCGNVAVADHHETCARESHGVEDVAVAAVGVEDALADSARLLHARRVGACSRRPITRRRRTAQCAWPPPGSRPPSCTWCFPRAATCSCCAEPAAPDPVAAARDPLSRPGGGDAPGGRGGARVAREPQDDGGVRFAPRTSRRRSKGSGKTIVEPRSPATWVIVCM